MLQCLTSLDLKGLWTCQLGFCCEYFTVKPFELKFLSHIYWEFSENFRRGSEIWGKAVVEKVKGEIERRELKWFWFDWGFWSLGRVKCSILRGKLIVCRWEIWFFRQNFSGKLEKLWKTLFLELIFFQLSGIFFRIFLNLFSNFPEYLIFPIFWNLCFFKFSFVLFFKKSFLQVFPLFSI